jgi:ferredoxin
MTLHPVNQWEIPTQTAKIAHGSFLKGNMYMKMYDELGVLYADREFAALFPSTYGKSAMSPGKLALITVMQFAEGLSDRQAADAESNQAYQVSLVGPVAVDTSWQAKLKTGFDISAFVIDWDKQVAICPQGNSNRLWRKARDCNHNPLIEIVFDRKTCAACPVRNLCTSSATTCPQD